MGHNREYPSDIFFNFHLVLNVSVFTFPFPVHFLFPISSAFLSFYMYFKIVFLGQAEKKTNALHVAARNGNIKMIDILLPHYDINSINESGETPLMLAAANGKEAAFEMLIQRDDKSHLEGPFGQHLLHFAAEGGNPHILRHLLSLNVDVNQRNGVGVTPLATAAIYGNQSAFELLLEKKADPFLTIKDGYSVLHFAAYGGSVPIISKLISLGLDKDFEGPLGDTPLIKATEANKHEAVQYLLSIEAK